MLKKNYSIFSLVFFVFFLNVSWGTFVKNHGGSKVNTIRINKEELEDFVAFEKHNIILDYIAAFFTKPLNQSTVLKIKEEYGAHQVENISNSLINQGLIHPYNSIKINLMNALGKFLNSIDRFTPNLKHTAFLYVIFIIISLFIIYREERKVTKEAIISVSILTLGFFGYASGILLVYLFVWDGFEANSLASFTRYLPMYLTAPTILSIALLISKKLTNKKLIIWRRVLIVFILCLTTLSTPRRMIDFYLLKPRPMAPGRIVSKKVTKEVDTIKTKKFLLLWPKSTVYNQYIFRYELYPRMNYIISGLSNALPDKDTRRLEFRDLFKKAEEIIYISTHVPYEISGFEVLVNLENYKNKTIRKDTIVLRKH